MRGVRAVAAGALAAAIVAGAAPAGAQSEVVEAYNEQPAPNLIGGFYDIWGDEYYAPAVAWMAGEGITRGCEEGRYCPWDEVTRAQMAAFLWRLAGAPVVADDHGFDDVAPGTYYDDAVRWMKAVGLTTGVGGSDRFDPDASLTRAEMAAFLWRYAGRPSNDRPHGFYDVPRGAYYDAAVRWLRAEGITTGIDGSDLFGPDQTLDRAQLATFVWRYEGRPAPVSPGDRADCDDFWSQDEAQAWFDLYRPFHGDVAHLDDDGDTVACEELLVAYRYPDAMP